MMKNREKLKSSNKKVPQNEEKNLKFFGNWHYQCLIDASMYHRDMDECKHFARISITGFLYGMSFVSKWVHWELDSISWHKLRWGNLPQSPAKLQLVVECQCYIYYIYILHFFRSASAELLNRCLLHSRDLCPQSTCKLGNLSHAWVQSSARSSVRKLDFTQRRRQSTTSSNGQKLIIKI